MFVVAVFPIHQVWHSKTGVENKVDEERGRQREGIDEARVEQVPQGSGED